MKLLFDYFPIVCFFIAYKLYGIFVATAVTMAACALQVGFYWLRHRRFETLHLVTLALVIILGGSTLIFHNDIFIKVKPSAIYWIFSLCLLGSQFIGKKNLMERMLSEQIHIPKKIWTTLNSAWAAFFLMLGFLNLYVVYHYSTNTWVNFKLFGTFGIMVVFIILQSLYLAKYIKDSPKNNR